MSGKIKLMLGKFSLNQRSLQCLGAIVILLFSLLIGTIAAKSGVAQASSISGTITTVAGGGLGFGLATTIGQVPDQVVIDPKTGGVLELDKNCICVREIMPSGDEFVIAGGGTAGLGNGGPAIAASLIYPKAIAADSEGNVYIIDYDSLLIRMVPATTGTYFGQSMVANDIYTIAGNGQYGFSGDGGPATSADMESPSGVTVDSAGNVYFSDTYNYRVRMVPAKSGTYFGQSMTADDVYTVAGGGTTLSDGVKATAARFSYPLGIAVDRGDNLYIADDYSSRVRMVPGISGTYFGQAMTAADVYTVAGDLSQGFSGDGGLATAAKLNGPSGVTVDNAGNLYIADDYSSRVRMVPATSGTIFGQSMTANDIYTIAGNGQPYYSGDGAPATAAELSNPRSVVVDSSGNIYLSDSNTNRVRMVPATSGTFFGQSMIANYLYTIAGNGTAGFSGDGGPATAAELNDPSGITVDSAGNIYIADSQNSRIRMVPAISGTYFGQSMIANDIYTIVGNGGTGFSGDQVWATSAELNNPSAIAIDSVGNIYIADSYNNRVRMVPATSGTYFGQTMTSYNIYTIAGNGTAGFSGDGGIATASDLYNPSGVTVDSTGNIYIADTRNGRIRMVPATSGTYFGQSTNANDIYTIVGNGGTGFSGDQVWATSAELNNPSAIAIDSVGNIYIADGYNNRVRMVPATSGNFFGQEMAADIIYTVAGGGNSVNDGGGQATQASLGYVEGVAIDSSGNLYIADTGKYRIQFVYGGASAPSAPIKVSASEIPSIPSLGLSWLAPVSNGDSLITDYIVGVNDLTTSTSTNIDTASIATNLTITGLSTGDDYDFTVAAVNSLGTSQPSTPSNSLIAALPGTPEWLTAVAGANLATLSWSAPIPSGGIQNTDYVVGVNNVTTATSTSVDATSSLTTYTVTGLLPGDEYDFTVSALNNAGQGPASNDSNKVQLPVVPFFPTEVISSISSSTSSLDLSWATPIFDGGSPITDYTVGVNDLTTSTTTNIDTSSTSTTYLVTGLIPGDSYDFTVSAVSAVGSSQPSFPSNSLISGLPGAPSGLSGSAGISSARLSWVAPNSDGGSPITDYTVEVNDLTSLTTTNIDTSSTSTSLIVTGLKAGDNYDFTISAINSVGQGPTTAPSNLVIPVNIPDAPSGLTATASNSSATISWIQPNNEGSPITSYTVGVLPGGYSETFGPNSTTEIVTGLTNGTPYTFTVKATNLAGTSPSSLPSNTVTPVQANGFTPLTPIRILDTRSNSGYFGSGHSLGAGGSITLQITG
ncbi:MAG: hypothetical protein HKL80_06535, partial [Acidimicrobiales bacterium]|nr:hypothetical protein [Acidimicrobiales bacterium]